MLVIAGFTVGRAFSAFMSVPDDKNEEDNSGTEHSEQTCEYACGAVSYVYLPVQESSLNSDTVRKNTDGIGYGYKDGKNIPKLNRNIIWEDNNNG